MFRNDFFVDFLDLFEDFIIKIKLGKQNRWQLRISYRNLHQDSSLEIVLVPSCRNQLVNELVQVFEHYREYSPRFFGRSFLLLYARAFARKSKNKQQNQTFIEHTSISNRVCRCTSSSVVTPRNVNIIGRPPQRTGRVSNCQRSVKIPGSVDLKTNESLSVSFGKMES